MTTKEINEKVDDFIKEEVLKKTSDDFLFFQNLQKRIIEYRKMLEEENKDEQ